MTTSNRQPTFVNLIDSRELADAQAEIDRLRAALSAAIPALRAAYKGGHDLTENDYETYKTAIQLTDPTPNDKG
jgi:hypothetical protein